MTAADRVLVVDDDTELRQILAMVLRAHGFETTEATDGFQALAKIRGGEIPSLILLDLRMPRMNGTEFLEALHGGPSRYDIPTVVMTGDVTGAPEALAAGAAACLQKPVDMDVLIDTVRRHARGVTTA